jgi:hypothetical protein
MYIGGEDYQNKLLTRREIVALITNVETNLEGQVSSLVQNATTLNYLASISSEIITAATSEYSLVYSDQTLSLMKSINKKDPVLISSVSIILTNVYDLCNFYDI